MAVVGGRNDGGAWVTKLRRAVWRREHVLNDAERLGVRSGISEDRPPAILGLSILAILHAPQDAPRVRHGLGKIRDGKIFQESGHVRLLLFGPAT